MNNKIKILFNDIKYERIFSIDMSKFFDENMQNNFNQYRGKRQWLYLLESDLKRKLDRKKYNIYFDELKYPNIGFIEKTPVKKEFMENNSPLTIEYNSQMVFFDFIIDKIFLKIHQDGVITIRFHTYQINHKKYWELNKIVNIIEKLKIFIKNEYYKFVQEMIKILNNTDLDLLFVLPKNIDINLFSDTYEIILFDYKLSNNKNISIKNMNKKENYFLLQQLVGFSRLARDIAWQKYSLEFCQKFSEQNIGSREDEYWLIYKERFIRYFANKNDIKASAWLNDAIIIMEITLAKKAMLTYIVDWTEEQLYQFRNLTLDSNNIHKPNIAELIHISIMKTYYLLAIINEPLIVKRYIHHEFFFYFLQHF